MKDEKAGWKEEFRQLVFSWSFWCMLTSASYELSDLLERHGVRLTFSDVNADGPGIIASVIMFIGGVIVLIGAWESIRLILWIISWVMMKMYENKNSIKKLRWETYLRKLSSKGWI